jgi:pyruvate formate lyase activating enzyme
MQKEERRVLGRIHSVETGGTIDGPGVRYVVFFQGCPLRCKFCHNPDTWQTSGGKEMDADTIISDILKYKNFIKTGGVTISGGEPMNQIAFLLEILKGCKANGIHTAVDTSGAVDVDFCKEVLAVTDLVLLDIKANDTKVCKTLTGKGNENAFKLLKFVEEKGIPVWIRHVVVPDFTDNLEETFSLAQKLQQYSCIKKIEILPFHKMGEYKWEALNLDYELKETKEPDKNLVEGMKEIFKSAGFWVG